MLCTPIGATDTAHSGSVEVIVDGVDGGGAEFKGLEAESYSLGSDLAALDGDDAFVRDGDDDFTGPVGRSHIQFQGLGPVNRDADLGLGELYTQLFLGSLVDFCLLAAADGCNKQKRSCASLD